MLAALALVFAQGTVEIPFRLGEDAIIVEAAVNGRRASFMFDTGFSGSLVLNDALTVGPAKGTMRLRDFVGEFDAKTVALKTLKIGPYDVPAADMEIVQQPLAHMSMSYNAHTDGIMGLEVFKGQVFTIDFQRKRFVVHPKSHDVSKRQPDGTKTFLAKMLPIGHGSIELDVATASGAKMKLALDTGNAYYATTHKDVLERIGLWKAGQAPSFLRTSWVASGPVDSWYLLMRDLTIFGVPVKESVWSIIDLPSSSADGDGTVGFGFLKNFNVTVDLVRRRVWMENFTGETGNRPVADVGLSAAYDPGRQRVRVYRTTPGGPAEKAGIKEGDDLLSIDGVEVLDAGFRKIAQMMEGERGSRVKLALSRSGNLMRYEMEREYLVNGMP